MDLAGKRSTRSPLEPMRDAAPVQSGRVHHPKTIVLDYHCSEAAQPVLGLMLAFCARSHRVCESFFNHLIERVTDCVAFLSRAANCIAQAGTCGPLDRVTTKLDDRGKPPIRVELVPNCGRLASPVHWLMNIIEIASELQLPCFICRAAEFTLSTATIPARAGPF